MKLNGGKASARRQLLALLLAAPFVCLALPAGVAIGNQERTPVKEKERTLWMTDLFYPVGDPDDHYDLAVGFATGTLQRGRSIIVVDELEGRSPNRDSVEGMARLKGRTAPPVLSQGKVNQQLRFLSASRPKSVRVITLGSLTGLAALLERNKRLVKSRVRSVTTFSGDSQIGAPIETNVATDPQAFRKVMTSGLSVRWVPCFDGGLWIAGTSSFVSTTDNFLLSDVRPAVFEWFRRHIGDRFGVRNLWAAGVITRANPPGALWRRGTFIFDEKGALAQERPNRSTVFRFRVNDRERYESWMLRTTRRLLASI